MSEGEGYGLYMHPLTRRRAVPEGDRKVEVGVVLREQDMARHGRRLTELASSVNDADLDHVTVGDHVSFGDGHGVDGLIQATALLQSHPELHVQTGVYLLGLRHPAVVARQLATIALVAPGRLTFGVGLGGDDPRELELCGVAKETRGARMTESLQLVQRFLSGERFSFEGRFFKVDEAAIRPAPVEAIPVLIGGRANAALTRTARFGEGWLAVWVSARRFREATDQIEQAADELGRRDVAWRHTMQLWAGFDDGPKRGRERIARVMEEAYSLPFDRFERYVPTGTPADVADWLQPYVEAGCRRFNVVPEAAGLEAGIAAVGELKAELASRVGEVTA